MWSFVLFFTIVQYSLMPVCSTQDDIMPGKPISGNQTIISANGKFALGFFKPGNSTKSYLGIWYHAIPIKTVVWVANQEAPLDFEGIFMLGSDGNLVVLDRAGKLIWSSNVSVADSDVKNTAGVLMDTGNLVLKLGEATLWQSFDYPSDTLLPGMKLRHNLKTGEQKHLTSWTNAEDPRPGIFSAGGDPTNIPQILIWKEQKPYWRSTVYYALHGNRQVNFETPTASIFLKTGLYGDEAYLSYNFTSNSKIESRIWLPPNGKLKVLIWQVENSIQWTPLLELPQTYCDFYGRCGPFGYCDQYLPDSCNCIRDFEPKVQAEWSKRNWTGGCVRKKKLRCKGDQFLRAEKMKLPDYSFTLGNISLSDCYSECLKNCSCTAYTLSSANCLNWFGDLMDLLQNSLDGQDIYIRVHRSEQAAAAGEVLKSTNAKKWLLVIALVIVCIGLLALIPGYLLWRRRLTKQGSTEGSMTEISGSITSRGGQSETTLVILSFRSILAATNNFSEANKLGEGGFGPVYKGILPEIEEVGIKRLSRKSGQGLEEFMNELKLIAKLQHKNLVRLLGCCVEGEEKILIYEYMPNRSLDKALFDASEKASMDWSRRFQIIEGIAQGLLYLHKYSRLKIIHRDLKAGNILLDGEMNPKISDFGMARIFGIDQVEANTNRVVGTYGYMSPEYALYGKFSEKSDVFSFGVLLLEIVSGKRFNDFQCDEIYLTLLGWAWEEWREGREVEIIDPSIRDTCCRREAVKCIQVGLLCVQEMPIDRPTMSCISFMLENETTPLQSPQQPAFCTRNAFGASQTPPGYSYDEGTMTMPQAR